MDAAQIVAAIKNGDVDEQIDGLFEALKARSRVLRDRENGEAYEAIKIGDRVRFNATARPMYLQYAQGMVVDKNGSRLLVDVDDGQPGAGKFNGMKGVKCPPSLLEVIQ